MRPRVTQPCQISELASSSTSGFDSEALTPVIFSKMKTHIKIKNINSQPWWCMLVIPALWNLRQKNSFGVRRQLGLQKEFNYGAWAPGLPSALKPKSELQPTPPQRETTNSLRNVQLSPFSCSTYIKSSS